MQHPKSQRKDHVSICSLRAQTKQKSIIMRRAKEPRVWRVKDGCGASAGEGEAAKQARCWSAAAASAPSGYLMQGLMCLNAVIVSHIPASCSPIKFNKVSA